MATTKRKKKAHHHKKPSVRRKVSGLTTTKKRTVKRRSVSGVISKQMGKEILFMAGGMIVAGIVKSKLLNPIEAKLGNTNAKLIAGGEAVVGGVFALKSKSPFMKGVGLGIMAGGVMSLSAQIWPHGISGDEIGADRFEIGEIHEQYVGEIQQQYVGEPMISESVGAESGGDYVHPYVPLGSDL